MFTIITSRLTLIRDLRTAICKVTFTKQDGSVTTRFVTLCTFPCITMPAKVRDTLDAEVAGADLQNPRACVLAWDVQGKHIISFAHDRVSEFYPILDCLC
jgi:hypothetical protein